MVNQYHLLYDWDRWRLIVEGGDDSIGEYSGKVEALAGAVRFLSEFGGSLRVHNTDGTIEDERTYPASAEPRAGV